MDLSSLVIFAGALLVAAASPGPGVAAITARVLGRGMQGAFAFTAGLATADVVWLTVAALGISAIAQTFTTVFLVIKYAGAAYLLYLAWRMWTAPAVVHDLSAKQPDEKPLRLYLAGLAVNMGNPKAALFYIALLPTIIETATIGWLGWLELTIVTLAVLALVFGSYILLAAHTRALFTTPRAMRLVNRGSGILMASAAAAVASR